MYTFQQLATLKSALQTKREILIAARHEAGLDEVSAVLALYKVFLKLNQRPTAFIKDFDARDCQFLPGTSEIQVKLPAQRLVIAIDMAESPVDKIDYETRDGHLYLNVTPRQGRINQQNVKISNTGTLFDFFFFINIHNQVELGDLGEELHKELKTRPIFSFSYQNVESQLPKINLVPGGVGILCVALSDLFDELGATWDAELANLILTGIVMQTDHFRQATHPDVLRTVAKLIERGGRLEAVTIPDRQSQPLPSKPPESSFR